MIHRIPYVLTVILIRSTEFLMLEWKFKKLRDGMLIIAYDLRMHVR